MAQLFRNNAFSNLGASLTNVGTTLTVTTGHGDRFPVVAAPDFMLLTLQNASNNIEIVKVTARTAGSDSMTIERAQEGTTARSWSLGDVVELRLTAGALGPLSLLGGASTAAAIRSAIGAGTGNGDVTLSGTQTLSNKTLTSPELTGTVYTNGFVRSNIVDLASGTDFNLLLGNNFIRTVNGNVTFTVSNAPVWGAYAFTVEITHTSGTITWFPGVVWPNNTAPTLTTGRKHLFTFVSNNGGTTWRGIANTNYTS